MGLWPCRATASWRALVPLLWCRVSPVPRSSTSALQAPRAGPRCTSRSENGIAQARIRPSSRPFHFARNDARARHRLRRRVARQSQRRGLVGHALAQNHPDARVLVGLQARVRELGAPGIEKAHRPVPDQLDQAEQRGVVLLLLGHRGLEVEDVHERARLLVGEDAAHRVRVADVHVAVEEARGDHEVPAVDHPVGARVRQLGRLPDPADAAALDQDRAVLDDPALPVEGEDVAGVVDLEALRWHGGGLPG